MKKNIIFATVISLCVLVLTTSTFVMAQQTQNTAGNATGTQNQMTIRAKTAVDKQLDKRIEDLGKLVTRIGEFKNIEETNKTAMTTFVNSLIADLNALRTEVDTTASTTVIKEARESITKNYRVYALVMPQLNIIAAADRITTAIDMMVIVASKIEARLNAIATSSQITPANIASAQKTLSSLKDKLVEAKKHAQSAVTAVSPLVPDQGDKAVMESNLAALKDGRAKIKQSYLSLHDAREDARTITKLLAKEPKAQASSTPKTN